HALVVVVLAHRRPGQGHAGHGREGRAAARGRGRRDRRLRPRPARPAAAAAPGAGRVIPLVRARGTHAEVGAAIGDPTAAAIRRCVDGEHLELAARYRAVTLAHLPWVVEELDAAAEAADVDPLGLFAASVEELSAEPRGCTDIVLGRLVAHNNDLDAAEEE